MELVSEKFTRQFTMDGNRYAHPFEACKTDYNVNFAENSIDSPPGLSCSMHDLDACALVQLHTSVMNPKNTWNRQDNRTCGLKARDQLAQA
jgi:hypothetical protein